jgi:hypothetical protein
VVRPWISPGITTGISRQRENLLGDILGVWMTARANNSMRAMQLIASIQTSAFLPFIMLSARKQTHNITDPRRVTIVVASSS